MGIELAIDHLTRNFQNWNRTNHACREAVLFALACLLLTTTRTWPVPYGVCWNTMDAGRDLARRRGGGAQSDPGSPDVIIVDTVMPGITVMEVARLLRQRLPTTLF